MWLQNKGNVKLTVSKIKKKEKEINNKIRQEKFLTKMGTKNAKKK